MITLFILIWLVVGFLSGLTTQRSMDRYLLRRYGIKNNHPCYLGIILNTIAGPIGWIIFLTLSTMWI